MSFSPFPSHYWVHVHLKTDTRCWWFAYDNRKRGCLELDILGAEAVPMEHLAIVTEEIKKRYGHHGFHSIEALPCRNECLTPEMKRTIRVV